MQGSGGSGSSSNSNSNNNSKTSGCGEAKTGAKTLGYDTNGKAQKRWVTNENNLKEVGEIYPLTTTSTVHSKSNNSSKISSPINSLTKTVDSQNAQEKTTPVIIKEGKEPEDEHPVAMGGVPGGGSCIENLTSAGSLTSTITTTTSPSYSSSPSCSREDDSVSQKKDDTYSSVTLRRSSLSPKDKKEEAVEAAAGSTVAQGAGCGNQNDSCYIDVLQNINYTRLLTDQILAVDRQVVAHCKARTDMSGKYPS